MTEDNDCVKLIDQTLFQITDDKNNLQNIVDEWDNTLFEINPEDLSDNIVRNNNIALSDKEKELVLYALLYYKMIIGIEDWESDKDLCFIEMGLDKYEKSGIKTVLPLYVYNTYKTYGFDNFFEAFIPSKF